MLVNRYVFTLLGLLVITDTATSAEVHPALGSFLSALHQVEASGRKGPVKGDNGRSLGPLQISKLYWIDSKVAGKYSDCANLEYSKRVFISYMKRHAPKALSDGDWQKLARIHNGGPQGHLRSSTIHHWMKVRKAMK